jgi:hypothetical protein
MRDIVFTSAEMQSILFQDWDLGDVRIEAEAWTFDDGAFVEQLLTRHALLDFGVLFDNLSATGVALAAERGAEYSTRFLSRGTVFIVTSDPVRKLTTVSIEMDDSFSAWPRTTSLRDALATRKSSK